MFEILLANPYYLITIGFLLLLLALLLFFAIRSNKDEELSEEVKQALRELNLQEKSGIAADDLIQELKNINLPTSTAPSMADDQLSNGVNHSLTSITKNINDISNEEFNSNTLTVSGNIQNTPQSQEHVQQQKPSTLYNPEQPPSEVVNINGTEINNKDLPNTTAAIPVSPTPTNTPIINASSGVKVNVQDNKNPIILPVLINKDNNKNEEAFSKIKSAMLDRTNEVIIKVKLADKTKIASDNELADSTDQKNIVSEFEFDDTILMPMALENREEFFSAQNIDEIKASNTLPDAGHVPEEYLDKEKQVKISTYIKQAEGIITGISKVQPIENEVAENPIKHEQIESDSLQDSTKSLINAEVDNDKNNNFNHTIIDRIQRKTDSEIFAAEKIDTLIKQSADILLNPKVQIENANKELNNNLDSEDNEYFTTDDEEEKVTQTASFEEAVNQQAQAKTSSGGVFGFRGLLNKVVRTIIKPANKENEEGFGINVSIKDSEKEIELLSDDRQDNIQKNYQDFNAEVDQVFTQTIEPIEPIKQVIPTLANHQTSPTTATFTFNGGANLSISDNKQDNILSENNKNIISEKLKSEVVISNLDNIINISSINYQVNEENLGVIVEHKPQSEDFTNEKINALINQSAETLKTEIVKTKESYEVDNKDKSANLADIITKAYNTVVSNPSAESFPQEMQEDQVVSSAVSVVNEQEFSAPNILHKIKLSEEQITPEEYSAVINNENKTVKGVFNHVGDRQNQKNIKSEGFRSLLTKAYRTVFKPSTVEIQEKTKLHESLEVKLVSESEDYQKVQCEQNLNNEYDLLIKKVDEKAKNINAEINIIETQAIPNISNVFSRPITSVPEQIQNIQTKQTQVQSEESQPLVEHINKNKIYSDSQKEKLIDELLKNVVDGELSSMLFSNDKTTEQKINHTISAKLTNSIISQDTPAINLAEAVSPQMPPVAQTSLISPVAVNTPVSEIVTPVFVHSAEIINHAADINTIYEKDSDKINDISEKTKLILQKHHEVQLKADSTNVVSSLPITENKNFFKSIADKISTISRLSPKASEPQEFSVTETFTEENKYKAEKTLLAKPTIPNVKEIPDSLFDRVKAEKKPPVNSVPSTFMPSFSPSLPPVSTTVIKLEYEINKNLGKLTPKSGVDLPKNEFGFLRDIESMFKEEDLQMLLSAIEAKDFAKARGKLNEVIEEQNRIFLQWRQSFGKFSRLFSLVSLPQNNEIAYVSMKKATELDPNDSWNWLAFAMMNLKREAYVDYRKSLEKALALATGSKISDLPYEVVQKYPKNNIVDNKVYVLAILELAKLETNDNDFDNAHKLYLALRKFLSSSFTNDDDEFFQQNHITSLIELAGIEKKSQKWKAAIGYLFEAIDLDFCKGEIRLNVILSAIKLLSKVEVSKQRKEQLYEEASALIAIFPQTSSEYSFHYQNLGQYNYQQKNYDKAKILFKSALLIDEKNTNQPGQVRAISGLAKCLMAQNKENEAFELYVKAKQIIDIIPDIDKTTLAEVNLAMGELFDNRGSAREAISYFQKAASIYNDLPANIETAKLIRKFAARQHQQKNYPASAELYKSLVHIYKALGDELALRDICFEQANNNFYMSDFANAELMVTQTISLLTKHSDASISAKCQLLLAKIAWNNNDIPRAEEKSQIAYELIQSWQINTQSLRTIIEISEFIGKIALRTGNYNLAVLHFNKSLSKARELADNSLEMQQLLFLAKALAENEDTPQSLSLLESAEQIAVRLSDKLLCDIRLQISTTLLKHGLYDQANNILQRLLIDESHEKNQFNVYRIHSVISQYFHALQNYDKAFESLKYAASGFKNLGKNYEEACQYFYMAEYLYKAGKFPDFFNLMAYSEKCFIKFHAYLQVAEVKLWIAKAKVKIGQNEAACESFSSAVAYYEKISASLRAGEALLNLGVLLMRMGKNEEAKKVWLKAREIFEKHHKPDQVTRVNNWLEMFNDETLI